jgi:hypothetical protein
MKRPTLEVADIIRSAGNGFIERNRSHLGWQQLKVLRAVKHCRTAALGGHLDQCSRCGYRAISFYSCRNRHCPKCQTNARNKWLAARSDELLGVTYSHVVFTLPHQLAALALQNKKAIYDLLFDTSAATLMEVAANPQHLGGDIGFLSVLHTWGQNLQIHPHLHCVVPAGALSPDHSRWIHPRHQFLLPEKVLSRVFRGKFVDGLKHLFRNHRLEFHGNLQHLAEPGLFRRFLRQLYRHDWVVHVKPPFGGPEYVLQYLARYTHRVAISNHRLISFSDGKVTFRWKDYAHGHKKRKMTLTTDEFLRRFLLHVLPRGFVRIRHYGFLSTRRRQALMPLCRQLLAQSSQPRAPTQVEKGTPVNDTWPCPCCGGPMIVVEKLSAQQILLRSAEWKSLIDSS